MRLIKKDRAIPPKLEELGEYVIIKEPDRPRRRSRSMPGVWWAELDCGYVTRMEDAFHYTKEVGLHLVAKHCDTKLQLFNAPIRD
jgi:hypothetical protein